MGSKNRKSKGVTKLGKPDGGAGTTAFGRGSRQNVSNTITDARFASIHTDPRFRKAPKRKSKVVLDSRFSHIFTDKNFASTKAKIDKRGKPKKDSSQNLMKHYYHLEEEGKEAIGRGEELTSKNVDVKEEDEEESCSEAGQSSSGDDSGSGELEKGNLISKLGATESENEDEECPSDDSSSTSSTDSDEENEINLDEEDTFVQEETIQTIEKETHRLAVVGMDWGRVKAVDIYVLLSSFLPKGDLIKSVAVYPTEFGLKRMEEEALHGPVGLFDEDENSKRSDDEDDDEIENEKLRKYELSRLRYYCAVVDCDSIATADYLYQNCDGVEFERTSNKLDLRFIPDSMEFKHEPRDVAIEAPANYEGLDFHTRALQHSNIELTWDEDEPQRTRTLKWKFNADQLAELELKEYLAPDDSDETDDDDEGNEEDSGNRTTKKHKKQEMYRSLLHSGDCSDNSDKDDDDDDQEDMEVTFNTGLEDLSKRILEKKDKQSESVWEAYLRKRKEKKKARKNRSKDSSDDESSYSDYDEQKNHLEEPDDFFVEEPVAIGNKDRKGKRAGKVKPDQGTAQEDIAGRAELELLLTDENGGGTKLKGYNMKKRKNKDRKGIEIIDEDKIPNMDYEDPRFSSLFTSPLFALDPTDPQFKRSAIYVRQMSEKQHKTAPENVKGKEEGRAEEFPSRKEKHELSSLVKSIKMKSKQIQPPSLNKATKKGEKLILKTKK
ncbi:unnamed protein product [Cuscuta epithymum]|uniref:NUC153 domain-containing protein n=1 Tax=Cuscuta epithymum TaxID=186058 RepID=A0AAV0DCM6_9ASTE|nr:unnamed protein product [Cuscuta epithymum]